MSFMRIGLLVSIAFAAGCAGEKEGVDTQDAPLTSAWSAVAPLPTFRSGFAATAGKDGKVYVLGGSNGGYVVGSNADPNVVPWQTCFVYSPATNQWSACPNVPTARRFLAAVTVPDGRILAIGGEAPDVGYLGVVEAYDPSTNTWQTVAPMPTPRSFLGAAVGSDGNVYAMGGWDRSPWETALSNVEVYSPSTNTWKSAPSMPTARAGVGVASGADGRIYAIGGQRNGWRELEDLKRAEALDPRTGLWTTLASPPEPVIGRVSMAGGEVYASWGAHVYSYDPARDGWKPAPSLPTTREVLVGSSDRLYALGGYDSSGSQSNLVFVAQP